MRLGPDDVLVAARVDVDDAASGGDLEQVADEVERRIQDGLPGGPARLPRPHDGGGDRAALTRLRCVPFARMITRFAG